MNSTSSFKSKVIKITQSIPYGFVASYGQVALYAGAPRAAREVGWTLNKIEDVSIPWWRVTNNAGRITIKGSEFSPDFQRKLLRAEGVEINDDFTFDIEKYRWRPTEAELSLLLL